MGEMDELSRIKGQRNQLRSALIGLVGAEDEEELQAMEVVLRLVAAPQADKAGMINAIHALLATAHEQ